MLPWANPSPYPKRHLDHFSSFCTAQSRASLYIMGRHFLPQIAPSHRPYLIHGSLGTPESTTQTASRSVQSFLHGSRSCQTDRPTDRQTDHATPSVKVGRIYVRSTATRPNIVRSYAQPSFNTPINIIIDLLNVLIQSAAICFLSYRGRYKHVHFAHFASSTVKNFSPENHQKSVS